MWDRGDGGILEAGGVDGLNAAGKLRRGEAVQVASPKASGEGMVASKKASGEGIDGWREASGDEEVDGWREASGDEEVDGWREAAGAENNNKREYSWYTMVKVHT